MNAQPHVLAWVSDLQARLPDGTYHLFMVAGNILKMVRANKDIGLQTFRHDFRDAVLFTWSDAAWATRPDGSSQGGHLSALAS